MVRTKKQILEEKIANAVGAGKTVSIETVDFSDPNRPKTVLEVDFPILPVNQVAAVEGNAGKPIYQMSKWWARRRSSVFRTMLLAAAMKAPDDPIDAAKKVWEVYYGNHQKKGALSHLKVADIFMGGGTTIVEGSRLGMQMYGNDLNPVAWLVVKNELADVSLDEIISFAKNIEKQLKPQIMPFYTCDCPRGHKGKWLKFENPDVPISPFFDEITLVEPTEKQIKAFKKEISTFEGWKKWYEDRGYKFEIMPDHFTPLEIPMQERNLYRYWGPEIIYTFWAKHGPCQSADCNHRTPIMPSPVIAEKELSIKFWSDYICSSCGEKFDVELKEARIAPGEPFVIAEGEKQFVVVDNENNFYCPSCNKKENISIFGTTKTKSKKVKLSLLIHPDWLKGSSLNRGGSATDSVEDTAEWNAERAKNLRYVEVRGVLPEEITCPVTGAIFKTTIGTVPRRSTFTCQSETCGREQDILTSIKKTGKTGPVSMYLQHCYCPECDVNNELYGGRFFTKPNITQFDAANDEWNKRKDKDLLDFWPKSELPYGYMTHKLNGGIPNHGFTHWWKMFNSKQLLVLSQLLKIIVNSDNYDLEYKELFLGAFQQYLRYQNMFVFWQMHRDCLAPHFSNNNFHPKSNVVENGVFSDIGSGNWNSCVSNMIEGLSWGKNPWELVSNDWLATIDNDLINHLSGKSKKVYPKDKVLGSSVILENCSSTALPYKTNSIDLVITDPPFGDILHYSELSDFFYVWLQLALKDKYPEKFSSEHTLKSLEAVSNSARHPDDPDDFYKRILTECWKEAYRILKPGGILSFTFHHSEDEPWIAVLESLFEAGFYLEATYPIRSDESKGENAEFGSKKIEYDIIHVCRKRLEEPTPISWARLRRRMIRDIRQLEDILKNHLASGLTESDLQVIRRGKALEYFSKHYGRVYVEEGREFTLKEALIGINQILDDERDSNIEPPPVEAEVMTRQFLRIFNKTISVQRNEMQNYLRGTGVSSSDFENKNWCKEQNRVFTMTSPLEFAKTWKGKLRKGLSYDLDQALFFIGACFENSGINVNDTLTNPNFSLHPAVVPILGWFTRNGGTSEIKQAAIKAFQICAAWQAKNPEKTNEQLALFGLDMEE